MDGKIYARGTQDMKCVTIQHIEAIRRLKESGKRFQRTVYLSFVPDEEIGGLLDEVMELIFFFLTYFHFTGGSGMKLFVEQDKFRDINPAVVLDEGLANPNNVRFRFSSPLFFSSSLVVILDFQFFYYYHYYLASFCVV